MKSLKQHISSDYLGAAQAMKSRKARRKIVVYVESYQDVSFWRHILSPLENETRYFQIMLPDALSLTKGKKQALVSALQGVELGGNIIACVDSDYDHLLQSSTATSRQINNNPYVFQTYAYAIENYYCYAPTLHGVCTAATLNDRHFLDFPDLLIRYSRIIYPLFLWNIHFYRRRREGSFSMSDFNYITRLERFNPFSAGVGQGEDALPNHSAVMQNAMGSRPVNYSPYKPRTRAYETPLLQRLQNRVDVALRRLRRIHSREIPAVNLLPDRLAPLGLTPDSTYLYIQGHHLVNQVVLPILNPICSRLRTQRETEIQQLAVNASQRQNELSAYRRALTPIDECLRKNYQFSASPSLPHYEQLLNDLRTRL